MLGSALSWSVASSSSPLLTGRHYRGRHHFDVLDDDRHGRLQSGDFVPEARPCMALLVIYRSHLQPTACANRRYQHFLRGTCWRWHFLFPIFPRFLFLIFPRWCKETGYKTWRSQLRSLGIGEFGQRTATRTGRGHTDTVNKQGLSRKMGTKNPDLVFPKKTPSRNTVSGIL